MIFATIGLSITLNIVVVGVVGVYPIPDLLHPASAASLGATLSQMSPASRQGYISTSFLDFVYPLTYAAALSGALARLKPRSRRSAWMPWVPIVGCAFDLVENVLLLLLVSETVPPAEGWLVPAAIANTLKWMCADFTMIAIATLVLWNGQRRWKA